MVPLPLPQVIGVFERLTGNPAWRHFEQFAGGAYEGRAEVELVVRSISQVGNYDYLVDWVFNQSGAIRVDVGLTGIDAPKAVGAADVAAAARRRHAFGAPVAPDLVAPYHSHLFNFRLDLDIDGQSNSFVLGELKERPGAGPAQERLDARGAARSRARATASSTTATHSGKSSTPAAATRSAKRVGYSLESHSSVEPLLDKADYQRAGFIAHTLWITAFDPDERYAAGDTPNQNPGAPGPAAIRAQQREPRQPRPRALADDRPPPRDRRPRTGRCCRARRCRSS